MTKKFFIIFLLFSNLINYAQVDRSAYKKVDFELVDLPKEIRKIHKPKPLDKKRINDVVSGNWSGYDITTNDYESNSISGSWKVPAITSKSKDAMCSIWVGIDGDGSNSVEQIGTGHYWYKHKTFHYAWYEMYPAASKWIKGFPVNVGDSISASVEYSGNDIFTMSIHNDTKRVSVTIPTNLTTSKTALRKSVEWIVETPMVGNQLEQMPNFGVINFLNCNCKIKDLQSGIKHPSWLNSINAITLSYKGKVKSIPSKLDETGSSFTVLWNHK